MRKISARVAASQSRLSLADGVQEFVIAVCRAGQRERVYQMLFAKGVWRSWSGLLCEVVVGVAIA